MKKLPIGIQTFSKIIDGNYVYVDKTREILALIQDGTYFFLSRPRRFGKSLLLSTLREIFSGNRELFQGLYIYDQIEWKTYPVIHLDFSLIPRENEKKLIQGLSYFVQRIAARHDIKQLPSEYNLAFQELILKLAEKYQEKVVVLIDEYDKAILDRIDEPEKAQQNREVLRNFYGVLKGSDPYLQFVFLTGVSKFSKVSIFSGLNNLKDLTMTPKFATMLGYTQEELERYFDDYLARAADTQAMPREELLAMIKMWYNGYSWDGKHRLYNPFSILNFCMEQDFGNYWFATGTPTFLLKKIREQQIDISALERHSLNLIGLDMDDIDRMDIFPLLFQTGYLTVKEVEISRRGSKRYLLSYPNLEVQDSLLSYLLGDFSGESASRIQPLHEQMFDALNAEDFETFIKMVQSLLASIPYPLHIGEEAYYHSLFYMILKLMGADISAEVVTNTGRVDGVLECDNHIYIIECKYSESGRTMEALTAQALQQIHDKKYYGPFLDSKKKVVLLGIGFLEKQLGYRAEVLNG